MNDFSAADVILDFENPWYPPSPEIFLTSLAWSLFSIEGVESNSKRRYRRNQRQSRPSTSVSTRAQTNYEYSAEILSSGETGFANELASQGFSAVRSASSHATQVPKDFVNATLNAVTGTTSVSSDGIAVSPLTPALAMAQNVKGMRGATANYALMVEQMWRVTGKKSQSLAESWLDANSRLLAKNNFLRQLDSALDATQGFGPRARKVVKEVAQPWPLADRNPTLLRKTPYGWFERSWNHLTSDAWVEALPPRVWTDWASTLIRTSFGLGILWQANWYHLVARSILDGDEIPPLDRLDSMELIPWQPRTMPLTLRHVKNRLDLQVSTSFRLKQQFAEWVSDFNADSESESWSEFSDWIRQSQGRQQTLANLKQMSGNYGKSKDAVEAVSYSLNVRKDFGLGADNFGLLRLVSRRFRVPQPPTEWLAAISSLVSPTPSTTINLGQLQAELHCMGLRPPTNDLILDLESAGLAKGSADADLGLEIQTAY